MDMNPNAAFARVQVDAARASTWQTKLPLWISAFIAVASLADFGLGAGIVARTDIPSAPVIGFLAFLALIPAYKAWLAFRYLRSGDDLARNRLLFFLFLGFLCSLGIGFFTGDWLLGGALAALQGAFFVGITLPGGMEYRPGVNVTPTVVRAVAASALALGLPAAALMAWSPPGLLSPSGLDSHTAAYLSEFNALSDEARVGRRVEIMARLAEFESACTPQRFVGDRARVNRARLRICYMKLVLAEAVDDSSQVAYACRSELLKALTRVIDLGSTPELEDLLGDVQGRIGL